MNTKKKFRLTKTLNIVESLVEEPEEVDENDCNQRTTLKAIFDQIRNRGERYSKLFPKRRVLEIPDESWSIQLSEDSESTVGSNNQSHRSRSNVSIAKVTSTPQRDFTKPYNDSLRLSIIPYGNNSPNSSKKRLPNSSKKGSTLKGKRAKLNETFEVIDGEEENAFAREDRSAKSSKANKTRCSNCASRMQESTVMSTFVERPSLLPPHLQTTIMDTSPYMSPLMSGETTVLPQRKSTVKQNKTHGGTILRETQTQTSAGTSPFEKTMLNKTRPTKRTSAPSAYHYTSLKDKLFSPIETNRNFDPAHPSCSDVFLLEPTNSFQMSKRKRLSDSIEQQMSKKIKSYMSSTKSPNRSWSLASAHSAKSAKNVTSHNKSILEEFESSSDEEINDSIDHQNSSDAAEDSEINSDDEEEEIQDFSDCDDEKDDASVDGRSVSSFSAKDSQHSISTLKTDVLGLINSVCEKVGSPKVAKAVVTEQIEKAIAAEQEERVTNSNRSISNISKRRSSTVPNVTITEKDGKMKDPPAKDATNDHSVKDISKRKSNTMQNAVTTTERNEEVEDLSAIDTSRNQTVKNISKRKSSTMQKAMKITEKSGEMEDTPAKDTTVEHPMDSSQLSEKSQGNDSYTDESSIAPEGTFNCEPGSSLELFSSIDGSESEQMIAAESTSVSASDQEPLKIAQETSSSKEQLSGKSSSSLSLCEQEPEKQFNSSKKFNSTMRDEVEPSEEVAAGEEIQSLVDSTNKEAEVPNEIVAVSEDKSPHLSINEEEEDAQISDASSISCPGVQQFSDVESETDVESTDLLESAVQKLETPKLKENVVANVQKSLSTKKQSKMTTTIEVVPYIKGNTPGKLDAQAKTLFDITLSPDQSRANLEKSVKVASPAELNRQEDQLQGSDAEIGQPQCSDAEIDQLQDPQEKEIEGEEDGHQEQEVKPGVSKTKGKVKQKAKPQKKAKKAASQSPDISMDKTKSLIIPDSPPEPGIRRSNRIRVKTCDFWRNERPRYEIDEEGLGYKIVGVDKGFKANASYCRKPKARKRMKVAGDEEGDDAGPSQSRSKAPQDLSIHVPKDMAENAMRLEQLKDLELFKNKQALKWKPSLFCGDKVQMAIIEKKSGDAWGLLKIAGTAKKPSQETGDYVTHITILHGVCQVYIGENYGILKSTDIFTVPPKTKYSVENLRRDEAELMFFVKKNDRELH